MRIIGLAGWSGSGKTTLIKKLIPRLIARGISVSTLKHAHHGFDLDQPGKDSHTHREAAQHRGRHRAAPTCRCCPLIEIDHCVALPFRPARPPQSGTRPNRCPYNVVTKIA